MPAINLPLEGGRTEAFRTGAPREKLVRLEEMLQARAR